MNVVGNTRFAAWLLVALVIILLLMAKPLIFMLISLIGYVFMGIAALVIIGFTIFFGYAIYRIMKWAWITSTTKLTPDFPEINFDL